MGAPKKFLTEAMLRALCLPQGSDLPLPQGTQLTPLAQEYVREQGLVLCAPEVPAAQGCKKEEHMTHLNAQVLVPKTHPRIRLRGKLDSLEALLLQTQQLALEEARTETAQALGEIYALVQRILAADVKEAPLGAYTVMGMDSAALRRNSHDPKGFAGLDAHPAPHAGMGRLCLALNFLRTQVRETELAAADAFILPDGTVERADLLEALNRLSSAVYLLFLKEIV